MLPVGDGPFPLHFARYERANVKGIITDEELAAALRERSNFGSTKNYVTWPDIKYPEKLP